MAEHPVFPVVSRAPRGSHTALDTTRRWPELAPKLTRWCADPARTKRQHRPDGAPPPRHDNANVDDKKPVVGFRGPVLKAAAESTPHARARARGAGGGGWLLNE